MISINLPPEIEEVLAKRAEAVGKDVTTFVQDFMTERFGPEISTEKPKTFEEFEARLMKMHERRIVPGNFDDSRESIYAGRGE
jgi:hypothetical protein